MKTHYILSIFFLFWFHINCFAIANKRNKTKNISFIFFFPFFSFGDGVSYPIHCFDEDAERLLDDGGSENVEFEATDVSIDSVEF